MDDESCHSGGYRLTFLNEVPDTLLCIFCHLPSRDPQLSTCCGYNMCRSCLDSYKQLIAMTQKVLTCPKCCHYDFKAYPNKMSARDIQNFVVLCSNEKERCKWQGKLSELNAHLENDCQFEVVECPKGCKMSLQRCDVGLHVKSKCPQLVINCPHCLVRGEKHFIEGQHLEKCPNLPLSCPNHCGATVNSETLDEHRNVCPLEVVGCEYNKLGCNTHTARRHIEEHNRESISKHLNLAKQKLACSTKELESSKMELATAQKGLTTLKATFGYSIDEVLVMIRLLNRLNLVQQKEIKNDLLRQIHLNYRSLLFLQGNQVAPVILKMNDFAKCLRNDTVWLSSPFFSHPHGYRLCLSVSASPADESVRKGSHLSLFITVMEGPHDNQLSWPMEGAVHLTLLNQLHSDRADLNHYMVIGLPDTPLFPYDSTLQVTEEDKHVKTPMGLMSSSMFGTFKFISFKKLNEVKVSCQFLKDDCIFFKVDYKEQYRSTGASNSYKKQESQPVRQNSQHFYRPPSQNVPSGSRENGPAVHFIHSPNDRTVSKQVRKIPETDTKL